MRKYLLVSVCLASFIFIGSIIFASSDESLIPSWIKNTANFWANDQISDAEFLQSLQWLIDNNILNIPESDSKTNKIDIDPSKIPVIADDPSFSGVTCFRDSNTMVRISGKYTNFDSVSYETIYFTFAILDENGNILNAREAITVNSIEPQQTKVFTGSWMWDKDFSSCLIEVNVKRAS